MSRVLQYRSVITDAITRGARTIRLLRIDNPLPIFETKQGCFADNRLALRSLSYLCTSRFHTSVVNKNEEPLRTPREQSSESSEREEHQERSQSQHEENYDRDQVQSTKRGGGNGEGGVLDRLRKLSMTSADEYVLSPKAQEKAREMSKVRAEAIRRGDQWKWDQKNVRPGGAPPPSRQYYNRRDDDFGGYNNQRGGDRYDNYNSGGMRGRNRYDEDDFEDNRQNHRGGRRDLYNDEDDYERVSRRSDDRNFGESRNRSFRRTETRMVDNEDVPENYELEMQKLRDRLEDTKIKKSKGVSKDDSEGKSERSGDRTSYGRVHENFNNTEGSSSSTYFSNTHEYQRIEPSDAEINLTLTAIDPDTFGNLSFSSSTLVKDTISQDIRNNLLEEEKAFSLGQEVEEEDDSRFIPEYKERWSSPKLIRTVRKLLKEKKLKEAVDIYLNALSQGGFDFDHDQLRHHFNVLINECADVGYVEMAFRLFNLMKKRGYKEKEQTISSLLNACANSPWDKEQNIDRIEKLLINIKDRGIMELNKIHYHGLIKAYGRLGETVRAFNVVDEMIKETKYTPITSTFNMLLQACISDTKNGFRYALITWRKLQSMGKMRPDIYSYNLLLRAVKDCGIELQPDDLKRLSAVNNDQANTLPLLPPVVTQEESNRMLSLIIPESSSEQVAEISLGDSDEVTVLSAKAVRQALALPTNRLAVIGGVRGILSQMVNNRVAPNLKTLFGLIQVARDSDIPDILQLLTTYKIKPDISFFNATIKQYHLLNQHHKVPEIVKLMNNVYHVVPNVATWCAFALGCQTWNEAKTLIHEIETSNFTPNFIVFANLTAAAMKIYDCKYLLHVLEEIKKRELVLDGKLILAVDNFIKRTQKNLVQHEMGKHVQSKRFSRAVERNPEFGEHFSLLKMRFKTWLPKVEVKVLPENPWKEEFQHFRINKSHMAPVLEEDLYESVVNAEKKQINE